MKLVTTEQLARQARKSKWAMQGLEAANKRKAYSQRARRTRAGSAAWTILKPPNRLAFHAPRKVREDFEKFVVNVNRRLWSGGKVTIDFSDIKRLYPCGLLLLMGLIDEWIDTYPGKLKAKYPKDDLAEQMLQHVGVLQDLGLPPRKQITHNDVNRWHYLTGSNVETGPFDGFMQQVSTLAGAEAQAGLYECISEAITNVKHHAYENGESDGWWAFCTVSERKIFVALRDRGATIPKTLLDKQTISDSLMLRKLRGSRADAELIASAVGGRTRTKLPHRGKGLREMYAFTKGNANSELGIYSRRGFFQYIPTRKQQETSGMIGEAVKGTLLIWMISLTGAES